MSAGASGSNLLTQLLGQVEASIPRRIRFMDDIVNPRFFEESLCNVLRNDDLIYPAHMS